MGVDRCTGEEELRRSCETDNNRAVLSLEDGHFHGGNDWLLVLTTMRHLQEETLRV